MTVLCEKLVKAVEEAIDSSKNYRVLVCGGRKYDDVAAVYRELDALQESDGPLTVIQGGATGADALARKWAYTRAPRQSVTLIDVPADWDKYGKAAGPIRNGKMLDENPDIVLAFPGGRGTANMVLQAEAAGVEIHKVGW